MFFMSLTSCKRPCHSVRVIVAMLLKVGLVGGATIIELLKVGLVGGTTIIALLSELENT